MKRLLILLVSGIWLGVGTPSAQAQSDEVQQLLLNVEKLEQLRGILDNMREKYQILTQGYNRVKGIAEGNFKLHEAFLNRLVEVNPNVKAYYKVGEILDLQLGLIRNLAKARREFRMADYFQEQELGQIDLLFGSWSQSSLNLLEELFLVLSDHELQMDDWERIQAIDRVHLAVLELGKGAAMFSGSLSRLGTLRAMKSGEILTLQTLIGDEN